MLCAPMGVTLGAHDLLRWTKIACSLYRLSVIAQTIMYVIEHFNKNFKCNFENMFSNEIAQ